MVKRRQLLRGEITYSTAKRKEVNILHRLTYPEKQNQFFAHIDDSHDWIKAVVAHHLNVHPSTCDVADSDSEWIYGSFNLCVPVAVRSWKTRDQPGRRVLLRLPLPYKVGEDFHPGNSDEKVRCEAGTYAWLQENCPEVPIPRLYGFALSSGETVGLTNPFTYLFELFSSITVLHMLMLRLVHQAGIFTVSSKMLPQFAPTIVSMDQKIRMVRNCGSFSVYSSPDSEAYTSGQTPGNIWVSFDGIY